MFFHTALSFSFVLLITNPPSLGLYETALQRQAEEIANFNNEEDFEIPPEVDYASIHGLSDEVKETLIRSRPRSIVRSS